MTTRSTFILADNQDITRAGIRSFIVQMFKGPHFEEASRKSELIEAMDKCGEGVVILDYTLFDFHRIEEFLILQKRFPGFSWVLFSSELSEDFIRRASVEENVGMVLKENSGDEIRSALTCAVNGERFLCHHVANLLLSTTGKREVSDVLTPAETEVLKLIAKGMSVKEIAMERVSSAHTIITHKKNIFRKLGINNVYEATRYALRAGLVEMMEYYI